MIELIAKIFLMGSIFGIGLILFRKIPLLLELPVDIQKTEKPFFSNLINKNKSFRMIKTISLENVLQKILSRIRILTLKIENKTSKLLQKLREKSKKKKEIENDNYWEKLRKSTNQKDKDLPM
jgi:TPP-dependent 2-oxoacid decarboxylase